MNPPVKDAGLRLGWLLAREPLGLLIGLAVTVVFAADPCARQAEAALSRPISSRR